jgi:hypothetical protein
VTVEEAREGMWEEAREGMREEIQVQTTDEATGVFGADITIHLCRNPEQQGAVDRFFEALVGHPEPESDNPQLILQQKAIAKVILDLADFLLAKNRKYGGAALAPSSDRTFARDLTAGDLIAVRMDDKLSRIRAGAADDDEDPYWDLAGYLMLREAGRRLEAEQWTGH